MILPASACVKAVLHIGIDVEIDSTVELGIPNYPIETLWIGDHVKLHGPARYMPRHLVIGDYAHLYEGMWCGGDAARAGGPPGGDAYFGHNVWMAPRCIADPTGGIYLGNGFGSGHETHLWSHIRHGDVLAGSRYLSYGRFVAEHDVWFVGRATGMPVWCEPFSMAMTSATVTKDMARNRVYAGTPAVDITEKVGAPYQENPILKRQHILMAKIYAFAERRGLFSRDADALASRFDVGSRTYTKTNEPLEVELMRYLLPEAKFVPAGQEIIRGGEIEWPTRVRQS